jgi:outer membrane lipopolysaccharide assembly protein LptE/RlpB
MPHPSALLRPALLLLAPALFIGTLAGCSHYQLGTGGRLAFATLYVAPVANKTILPQAQAIVSTALREELLHDGRVVLVNSPEAADATLSVTLVDYHRDVATVRPGDNGLAREFALTLGVAVTLRDNRTGNDFFTRRPVSAVRDAFTDSGQLQAEYQSLPLLAGELAKKTAHAVLDVW